MNLNKILNQPFTFARRSQLIPGELRPIWKVSLILLIFGILAKSNKCSLKKLHIANWVTKSEDHIDELKTWSTNTTAIRPDIRIEPSLDRAIELMVGDNLLIKTNGKLEVTKLGLELFKRLDEADVLKVEKDSLLAVKKIMTEANVERIFKVA